ncbi:unnamed protein product [Enterobius vermicularis]|uniref:Uncharacterized protein n=1 Tax=Enterobius vermicularis TaxID=51028 RepID=A0A0N4VJC4_ENTVE|nr:unnamed protein product [Enterobius vermicularis]
MRDYYFLFSTLYRIIGLIVCIILLCICCFSPCICLAGVWFAGWFGLRNPKKRQLEHRAESPPRVVIQNTAPSAYIPQRETHETRNGGGGRTEEILYQVREVDRRIDSSSGPQGYDRYERHKPSRL